jgi:hypothetical protein
VCLGVLLCGSSRHWLVRQPQLRWSGVTCMVRAHSTAKLPTSPLMSSFDHARHTATQRANIHCLERTDLSTFRYTYELQLITGTWSVYLQALVNQLITGVSQCGGREWTRTSAPWGVSSSMPGQPPGQITARRSWNFEQYSGKIRSCIIPRNMVPCSLSCTNASGRDRYSRSSAQ